MLTAAAGEALAKPCGMQHMLMSMCAYQHCCISYVFDCMLTNFVLNTLDVCCEVIPLMLCLEVICIDGSQINILPCEFLCRCSKAICVCMLSDSCTWHALTPQMLVGVDDLNSSFPLHSHQNSVRAMQPARSCSRLIG